MRRGWRPRCRLCLAALALASVAACAGALPASAAAPRCCHRASRRRLHRRETGITAARARQIQTALVKAGYLRHATGRWNWATHEALVRYQRAHGWQTRWVPDSRALIALGVGPKRDEPPRRPSPAGAAKPSPAPASRHPR